MDITSTETWALMGAATIVVAAGHFISALMFRWFCHWRAKVFANARDAETLRVFGRSKSETG